jgi:hypothetical protein
MKYIEKSRLETFLKLKGYEVVFSDSNIEEKKNNICWHKSDGEKISVPRRDVFQSNDLPLILMNENLLKEFRKF